MSNYILADNEKLAIWIEPGNVDAAPRVVQRGPGAAVPEAVWAGRTVEIIVAEGPAVIDAADAAAWVEDARPLLERIAAGLSHEWDGSRYAGRLTADARDALDEVQQAPHCEPSHIWQVWSAEDWIAPSIRETVADCVRALGASPDVDAVEAWLERIAAGDRVALLDAAKGARRIVEEIAEQA